VLVATPEALASPRVADEWQSFIALQRDRNEGRLHIVHLVDVPLPPFLAQIQCVDFRQAGEASYLQALRKLTAGILGHPGASNLPELLPRLTTPRPPETGLSPALRSRLVEWLTPVLAKKILRLAAASGLHIAPEKLEGQPSWQCTASAVLVWSSGNEERSLRPRIVDTLRETFRRTSRMGRRLCRAARRDRSTEGGEPERSLIEISLQSVAKDHGALVPSQEQVTWSLDRVFVQLELRPDARRAVEIKGGQPADGSYSICWRSIGAFNSGSPGAGWCWATPAPAKRPWCATSPGPGPESRSALAAALESPPRCSSRESLSSGRSSD
jgi:hypothetical protein